MRRRSLELPCAVICALLVACGAAPVDEGGEGSALRHTELVESEVLRTVQGSPEEAIDHARQQAVLRIAEQLDPTSPSDVAKLRIDVSLTAVSETPSTIRVRALVAVHTVGPPEQMRAMLQGTGTVQRGTNRTNDVLLAAEGAVRGALRRLLEVLERLG